MWTDDVNHVYFNHTNKAYTFKGGSSLNLFKAHLLVCTINSSVSFSPDRWLVSKSTDRWYWGKKG